MKKTTIKYAIIGLFATPLAANADTGYEFPTGVQFGAGMSITSGIHGFVGFANKEFDNFWAKRFGVRFDFASISPISGIIDSAMDAAIGDNLEIGDTLHIKTPALKGHHIGALVDFYPFGNTFFAGGWRLTGGYIMGKLALGAQITGQDLGSAFEFSLNDQDYRYNGGNVNASADITWKYRGPYLGTGFDIAIYKGFKMYLDAGVVFSTKAAQINLSVPINNMLEFYDTNTNTWRPVDNATVLPNGKTPQQMLDENIDLTLRDAQDDLNDIKLFPMVKLGFMYRF